MNEQKAFKRKVVTSLKESNRDMSYRRFTVRAKFEQLSANTQE
jgi:hypothetical protein